MSEHSGPCVVTNGERHPYFCGACLSKPVRPGGPHYPCASGVHYAADCKDPGCAEHGTGRAPAPPPAQSEAPLPYRDEEPIGINEVVTVLGGDPFGYVPAEIASLRAALAAEKSRADEAERERDEAREAARTLLSDTRTLARAEAAEAEVARLTGELRRREEQLALVNELPGAWDERACRLTGHEKSTPGDALEQCADDLRTVLSPPSAPDATPAAQPAATKDGEDR